MKYPSFLLPHTATVKPFQGSGAYGPVYGDASEYRCRIEPKRSLVRDMDGREVVSSTRGFFEYKGKEIPSQSEVVWNGQTFHVIDSKPETGLRSIAGIEVRM